MNNPTFKPKCDCKLGNPNLICVVAPTMKCVCRRCEVEGDGPERFYSCNQHHQECAIGHRRIRGREPIWSAIMVALIFLLSGCGRIGYELLPLEVENRPDG